MTASGDSHERLSQQHAAVGSSDRAFGLVMAAAWSVYGAWPLVGGRLPRWWAIALSAAFVIAAWLAPSVLAPLNQVWTKFGRLLHSVTTPIVMGALFYLAITPMGLLLRASGKDPLRLQREPDSKTYWIHRKPPGPLPSTLQRQF
jgi:hypothetical protein